MAVTTSSEKQARDYLAGTALSPADFDELVRSLQNQRRFGLARRVLERARSQPGVPGSEPLSPERRFALARNLALCTYMDPDLPLDSALDRALAILREACNLEETQDQEVLGRLGAIFKRRWESRARTDDLERSLAYYSRGAEIGSERDDGYNAINAAFVLDLLAEQADSDPAMRVSASPISQARRQRARELRQRIVEVVPIPPEGSETKDDWWRLVTVAEAHFGLRDYGSAKRLLRRAGSIPGVPDWNRESTARQLARLARCHNAVGGMDGATPGKAAFGLRVVTTTGEPINPISGFIRYTGYLVSGVLFLIGFLMIFGNRERRGFHDYWAGTLVVKSKRNVA